MLAHHVTKLSADAYLNPTIHIHSSQDSNPTPPVQPPSHARRWTQGQGNGNLCLLGINCVCILCRLVSIITFCSHGIGSENGQKRGRGPLKGLKAISKRIKAGNQKMKVDFSRLGGPVGDNYRSFVDEIVMFTRKRAPLIGVKTWKHVHEDVKESIASDILVIIIFACVYISILI